MVNVKASRADLKKWRDSLKVFTDFLPILQLKKQQLQTEVRRTERELKDIETHIHILHTEIEPWVTLFSEKVGFDLADLVKADRIVVEKGNIAGIELPFFERVDFSYAKYSLLSTSPWIDAALDILRKLALHRAQEKLLRIQIELLRIELRKTSQRVNLFEKIKIPEAKDAIRIIKILLGDEQTAAVCRSKIAKAKNASREVS